MKYFWYIGIKEGRRGGKSADEKPVIDTITENDECNCGKENNSKIAMNENREIVISNILSICENQGLLTDTMVIIYIYINR